MKKIRILTLILISLCLCAFLFSCGEPEQSTSTCAHEYDNECDSECNICGAKRAVLSHLWRGANQELCQYKQTCAWCGLTRGENVEHNYVDENGNMLKDCISCGHPNPITMKKTVTLKFNYSYWSAIENENGEPFAELLLDDGILNSSFGIEIPDEITAGDTVTITYTGEIVTLESYPATICLEYGEVKSYYFSYAQVTQIATEDIINDMGKEYNLMTDYVILDRSGKYIALESYTGDMLYLVYDNLKAIQSRSQPSVFVDPRFQVACMLAYNPRDLGEINDMPEKLEPITEQQAKDIASAHFYNDSTIYPLPDGYAYKAITVEGNDASCHYVLFDPEYLGEPYEQILFDYFTYLYKVNKITGEIVDISSAF